MTGIRIALVPDDDLAGMHDIAEDQGWDEILYDIREEQQRRIARREWVTW